MSTKIDIIGDLHGHKRAFEQLARRLGYAVDVDWSHPEGRRLLFVGDLIDRGPESLALAQLVHMLSKRGIALCLLGNHEYNLVEWRYGRSKPKSSNRSTIESFEAQPQPWAEVLGFFRSLPVAIELPDLRVIHASWYRPAVDALASVLRMPSTDSPAPAEWAPLIALHAVYVGSELRPGIAQEPMPGQTATPLEIVIKGPESRVQVPFRDHDGALRHHIRTPWWNDETFDAPRDKRVVFGHYWNMPPLTDDGSQFAPPHPSGHPDLRAWIHAYRASVPDAGRVAVPDEVDAVCVDYSGLTEAGRRACAGAYRYPEGEVIWACAPYPASAE